MYIEYIEKTESIEVNFKDVEYGLIFFSLKLGEQSFETNFSDVFDPLLSFKTWLEAISLGVPQCSFLYDPEGDEVKFNFERTSYDREFFTVSYAYDDDDIFLSGKIQRKQLVKEFYIRFLEFTDSEKFTKHFWEKNIFSERLIKLLKIHYETLIDKLVKLGRKQLNDWLILADSRHRWSEVLTEEGEKELAVLLKAKLANAEDTFFPEMERKEIRWNIPFDYSIWSVNRKRKFIAECISENCSPHNGTKIANFRSKIIEKYLKS
ncbi:MAG: hypothetical protein M3405_16530 [Acidobacteriota bacterium]|nr:hypothetical protein [Acidobacteriota bacterium]